MMWEHMTTDTRWEVWIQPPGEFTPYRFMDHSWSERATADAIRTGLSDSVRECAYLVKVTRERVR